MKKSNKKLVEGLQEGDLRDLVLPLISMDQYFPKSGTDDEVIVVAFFISDGEAAQDFTRFVSKTSANILDVETSPAPNPEGYWLAFVEMLRNDETVDNIMTIVDELETVTKIKKYKARIHKVGTSVAVDTASLNKYLDLDRSKDTNEIREWLGAASEKFEFTAASLNETSDTPNSHKGRKFVTMYFGDINHLPEQYECMECFGNQTLASKKLNQTLGSEFEVLDFSDYMMVTKPKSNSVLLVKLA
jgi:hypothetical protein